MTDIDDRARPVWSTALPDWSERLKAGTSLCPVKPLFPEEAAAAMRIFDELIVADVIGKPMMGKINREWIREFVSAIFGALDPITGIRLINEFFLLISKKNSKSTTAAGIMLTALLRNFRHSGEFIILAPTLEVAKNSAEPAMDFVNEDPLLKTLLKPVAHTRTIEHRTTGAELKIVAADSDIVGGKKAIGVLLDELWLFGKMKNAAQLLREAVGGLASRPEGFVCALSTHSDEPPEGIFKQWLDRYRKIRDGKLIMPKCLGILYEWPVEMIKAEEYKNPANWGLTNPNLGASVQMSFLEEEHAKAVEAGPGDLAIFYAKHLNLEIGMNLRGDRWEGADYWLKRIDRAITLEDIIARCDMIVTGIDGGGLDDLLALAIIGREMGTGRWLVWNHTWCHEKVLERRKSEAPKLLDFERAGELTIVKDDESLPGCGEYLGMDAAFEDLANTVQVAYDSGYMPDENAIGVDPAGVAEIVNALSRKSIGEKQIVGISQGWKLNGAIKSAAVRLSTSKLWHAGQGIVAWAVGNAKAEQKGNAVAITKQVSGACKIDPLMAIFDAVAIMGLHPEGERENFDMFFVGDGIAGLQS